MAEKVIGTLEDYITLDEATMTLARMRMHRTVRNASKEFLMRFFDAGWVSMNKSRARNYLPPRRQWARPGPKARDKKNTGQLQVASIMRCIRAHEKAGTLGATEWGGRLVHLVADVQRRVKERDISIAAPRKGKVPKLTVSGRRETRDIAIFDDLADAVLLSRTAAYLEAGCKGRWVSAGGSYSQRRYLLGGGVSGLTPPSGRRRAENAVPGPIPGQ